LKSRLRPKLVPSGVDASWALHVLRSPVTRRLGLARQ
jgi:hypothetical protein